MVHEAKDVNCCSILDILSPVVLVEYFVRQLVGLGYLNGCFKDVGSFSD